jgi:hypothetical protein
MADADFREATLSRVADLRMAVFNVQASFLGTEFADGARFHSANFRKEAGFGYSYSTFERPADFQHAQFGSSADFYFTVFRDQADFSGAIFGAAVNSLRTCPAPGRPPDSTFHTLCTTCTTPADRRAREYSPAIRAAGSRDSLPRRGLGPHSFPDNVPKCSPCVC